MMDGQTAKRMYGGEKKKAAATSVHSNQTIVSRCTKIIVFIGFVDLQCLRKSSHAIIQSSIKANNSARSIYAYDSCGVALIFSSAHPIICPHFEFSEILILYEISRNNVDFLLSWVYHSIEALSFFARGELGYVIPMRQRALPT